MPETPLPPFEILQQTTGAFLLSRCLQVVADLGVADALGDKPQSALTLAQATGGDPGALGRVLTLLAAHGIFEHRDGSFGHTLVSQLLRSDHPQSMRSFVRMFGLQIWWKAAEAFEDAVKTGRPVAHDVIPGGMWNYFAQNPGAGRIFSEAMTAKTRARIPDAVAAYEFCQFGSIADIGGGHGHLLKAILDACPNTRGVLFDLPNVIEQAAKNQWDRTTMQAGDFFKDEIPVADAYVLMEVIHDWGDGEAEQILRGVRRAAPKHAKLLLIEATMSEEMGPCWTRTMDIVMLLLGGRQRSYGQYDNLLARAGFHLDKNISLGGTYSLLEASVT